MKVKLVLEAKGMAEWHTLALVYFHTVDRIIPVLRAAQELSGFLPVVFRATIVMEEGKDP